MTLVYKGSGWYLYGFCRKRADYRLFRLSRIRELTVKGETFTHGPAPTPVSPRRRPRSVPLGLTLRCSRRVAAPPYEELPLEPERVVADGDQVRVRADWPDDPWTYSMLLGMGTEVEVLEPRRVRLELARMIGLMAEKYRGDLQS